MFCTGREALIALAIKNHGDWDAIIADIRSRKSVDYEEGRELLKSIKCKVLTSLDAEYPDYLRNECHKPPFVLFYYGDIRLIQDRHRVLTVVGSRDCTDYAAKKTRSLCQAIADKGYIICSGLARGIDTVAAEATCSFPGKSIAVLGCGIERCYPLENESLQERISKNGLVISEYPGMTLPDPRHFPARNRLLACMCHGVFVGEVRPRSGTMITVAFALHYNRDVGTLPFRCDEEASNNSLLKNGSALIENVEDLELFLQQPPEVQVGK